MKFNTFQNSKPLKSAKRLGWKLFILTDLLKDDSRNVKKIKKANYQESGLKPIIDQGKQLIGGYSNLDEGFYDEDSYIIFGDHTRIVKYIDFPSFVGADGVKVLRNKNKEIVDTKYLYYFLQSINIPDAGYSRHFKFLKEVIVPVPSLKIQLKIVDIMDKIHFVTKKRVKQIKALSALKQSVFLDMFGDPVTNPNNYLTQQLDEICINILGGGTPTKRKPEYYIGDIPWVTPKDMKTDTILEATDYINNIAIENSSAKLIPDNSLLMVIRSGILKHTLPLSINKVEVAVNQDMKAFVVDENKLLVEYLFFYFKCMENKILSKVRAVTAHNIEFKELLKSKVPLPELNLQNQFRIKIKEIEENIVLLKESLKELNTLYDSLLQKAFNGELFKVDVKA